MAKFVIECPHCGNYAEASKGFLGIGATKTINCSCGQSFDVKANKMASIECVHCGNTVIYDQSKGDKATCPVCHEKIVSGGGLFSNVEVTCPSCNCKVSTSKKDVNCTCPLCNTTFDVAQTIAKEKAKNEGLASLIKYEGDNNTFVWKHPIEDFNLGSQLIVHESQEAIFFKDGKALDLFGAGRYTLATQNLPLLENLYKLPFDGSEVFHSEVYFINMTTQMGIKWGTDSKVRLFDPASGLHIEIGACGNFNLRVTDSRKLLVKVVGTMSTLTQSDIAEDALTGSKSNNSYTVSAHTAKFKSLVMTKVKSNLARAIKENNINILEVDSYLDVLSESMRDIINVDLDEYGLAMPEFYITAIMTPDDDPNFKRLKQQFAERTLSVRQEEIRKAEAEAAQQRKLVEAQTEAQLKILQAQADAEAYKAQAMAEAEEMRMKGYTYQQETARQVGMEAMKNGITGGEGGGGGLGDIAGLGVTLGAMGGVMNMTKDALNPILNNASDLGAGFGGAVSGAGSANTWDCACGRKGIDGKFCTDCGAKKPEPVSADTWDCECGTKGITGKFCSECGAKKPEKTTWDCDCGAKGITGKFCSECGAKKPEKTTWDCECGAKNISGKFCSECGKKKEDISND